MTTPTVPTARQAEIIDDLGLAPQGVKLGTIIRDTALAVTEAAAGLVTADATKAGAIAYSSFPYTGQPSDTETVTIGADVYEFCTAAGSVAADARIAVLIGGSSDATAQNLVDAINAVTGGSDDAHPTLFRTNGTTAAHANGTEDVLAVLDSTGDVIYLYNAAAPGSATKVQGSAPSLALADTATNMGPWKWTNLNLSTATTAARMTQMAALKHTIVAGDLAAAAPLLIPLPFTPLSWHVTAYDTDGQLLNVPDIKVTVPAAVGGQAFLGLTFNATAATDIAATNVIHIVVFG